MSKRTERIDCILFVLLVAVVIAFFGAALYHDGYQNGYNDGLSYCSKAPCYFGTGGAGGADKSGERTKGR